MDNGPRDPRFCLTFRKRAALRLRPLVEQGDGRVGSSCFLFLIRCSQRTFSWLAAQTLFTHGQSAWPDLWLRSPHYRLARNYEALIVQNEFEINGVTVNSAARSFAAFVDQYFLACLGWNESWTK